MFFHIINNQKASSPYEQPTLSYDISFFLDCLFRCTLEQSDTVTLLMVLALHCLALSLPFLIKHFLLADNFFLDSVIWIALQNLFYSFGLIFQAVDQRGPPDLLDSCRYILFDIVLK